MDLDVLRKNYKDKILKIAQERGADQVRVFGAVVHGTNNDDSDIDFLVHVNPKVGLKFFGINEAMEEVLGCKVDVIPDSSIHWYIKDRINNEAEYL